MTVGVGFDHVKCSRKKKESASVVVFIYIFNCKGKGQNIPPKKLIYGKTLPVAHTSITSLGFLRRQFLTDKFLSKQLLTF